MATRPRRLGKQARIVIAGAGSIGCFIGGLLVAGGRSFGFLGRPRIVEALQSAGLHLTDLDGLDEHLPARRLTAATDAAILADADLIIVAVKSGGTAAIAGEIAAHCSPDATILSLQNGVGNLPVLRSALAGMEVRGGIVEFNVIEKGAGHFHRGTSGKLMIEAGRADLAALLAVPGLTIAATPDLASLQWGKLLINLNNALNALSGLPLREQMQHQDWRRLHAGQTEEALRAVRAAGIRPAALPLPPHLIPKILRLPTPLFRIAAAPILRIDPEARSSMWEDLMRRRPTEIDHLQGEIVRLGVRHGIATPLCEAIAALVKQAEAARAGPPGLTPDDIRQAVGRQ
jgi:2-dehydropantoate 2-reductase